jgi:NAD(P)H-dependent flavin oxidoreductase YrpB (nitropropane dioxygenase family)
MGTRFLCTAEAPVHRQVKQRIVEASERDTELIFRSLNNTARVASNGVSREVVQILQSGGKFEDIRELVAGSRGRRVYEDGDTELGIWTVGIVPGLIRDIPTVAELVTRMVSEAEDLIKSQLGRLVGARRTAAR